MDHRLAFETYPENNDVYLTHVQFSVVDEKLAGFRVVVYYDKPHNQLISNFQLLKKTITCNYNSCPVKQLTVKMLNCDQLADKLAAAKELFSRIEMMYETLPDFVKPGVKEYNKTSMVLENGSKISCAATSASAIRGRSIGLLICDEFAFFTSRNC